MSPRPVGIYLHWPYCERKCLYCDFASVACADPPVGRYVTAVCSEFDMRIQELEDLDVVSVYIGGGTPSLLPPEALETILAHIRGRISCDHAEITLEVNPSRALSNYLTAIRTLGVNRLSVGVQSTHDDVLHFLGRLHNAAQALFTLHDARKAGFDNLSVDLILASAPSRVETLEDDFQTLLAFRPEHVSAYCLTIEDTTPFGQRAAAGEMLTADEDEALAQLRFVRERLTGAGYEHYEISNFALPGFRAVHNSLYWSGAPYLGLGPAAHSYRITDGVHIRRENTCSPEAYFAHILRGEQAVSFEETLTAEQRLLECVMTALRRREGLSLDEFRSRTGMDFPEPFQEVAERLCSSGLCEWVLRPDRFPSLCLTEEGLVLSDTVFLEFGLAIS